MKHRHSVTDNPSQLAIVATVAAFIGALTALIVTPRNGKELREDVRRRAMNVKDSLVSNDNAVDEAQQTVEKAKTRAASTASKVAEDVKSTARKVKDDAQKTADESKAVGRKATKTDYK